MFPGNRIANNPQITNCLNALGFMVIKING
jgi:hypothetical protein